MKPPGHPLMSRSASFVIAALLAGPAHVADVSAQQWVPQGPAPNTQGQVENIANGEVEGGINAVAPHPTDPNTVYVGAVNGGIWKTSNGMDPSPTWLRQTDFQRSLSIGAVEFDPTDPSNQTLLAGIGRFSSFGDGGARTGLLRTTNGGATWTPLDGGGTLVGQNFSGVAPRGATLVVAATTAGITAEARTLAPTGRLFRARSGHRSANRRSFDLASDPTNPAQFFTNASTNGSFRSTDTGATWTQVSNAAMNTLMAAGVSNVDIAVGFSNNVYVAIVQGLSARGCVQIG